jgi:hypothetical protein
MHQKFMMKQIHYIHHKSNIPTVYSVFSFHWIEALLLSTVPITIIPLIPFSIVAVSAVENALQKSSLRSSDVALLCTGTTQGDLLIPGFASMVHAGLDFDKCEVASFQSVCASTQV